MLSAHHRTFVALIVLAVVTGCGTVVEREVGDQTELILRDGGRGVKPDVVFYELTEPVTYGVRRIGNTSGRYWQKCEIFRLAPTSVDYWDEQHVAKLSQLKPLSNSVAFAKRHCENFQSAQ